MALAESRMELAPTHAAAACVLQVRQGGEWESGYIAAPFPALKQGGWAQGTCELVGKPSEFRALSLEL